MGSITPLAEGGSVGFMRRFHVEMFRGGMNRLLLRTLTSADQPDRIEVLFQYVQHLDIAMAFDGLAVEDSTLEDRGLSPWAEIVVQHPECRVYRLLSGGRIAGRVVAAACSWGEDQAPAGNPSMFAMM